jgi:phosphotransferase system enzyme I (PtsI)
MSSENIIIKGVPVSPGVAMGEAQVLRDRMFCVVRRHVPVSLVKNEINRLKSASQKVIEELKTSKEGAVRAIGEPGANVFEAQVMIASDQQFFNSVAARIARDRVNAEFAYQEALAETLSRLEKSEDTYLRQMVHDIRSVSERVLSFLLGVRDGSINGFDHPTILVGRIFSPGRIMAYSKKNLAGLVTEEGGPTSHMGLIARSLGIPTVMGDFNTTGAITSGIQLIIDGNNGEVIINPDAATWRNYRRIRLRKRSRPFAVLIKNRSIEPVCLDGKRVTLAANLEIPGPLDEHLVRLGIGVGLYRTEFLYFKNQTFPDEDQQFEVYSRIARRFHPLPVTLRTFDLGGDKYAEELGAIREDNPALGWRGIRVSLDAARLFRIQLRAILRASVMNNIRILLPMVSDAREIAEARDIIGRIKRELRRSKIPFDKGIRLGAMIEIPSAAMAADFLAEKSDFFSIGTNDLIQYTMAADRGNHRVARYYMGHHPAVLKLIQITIRAAHNNGIPVSVCGEMAGSKTMTPLLIGLGVDELSMTPTQLPIIADWISRFSYYDAKRFSSRVMRLNTAEKVSRALSEAYDYVKNQKKGSWLEQAR